MFSNLNRTDMINKLEKTHYDVLIIGGGITGAGIALDATTRGMRTVLLDMQDFSAGTSSRSTKLVHGGLRYLKQFQVKLVAEVGKERAIVYENGPHVTKPEWMLLPFHEGGTFGKISTSIGLLVYDFLAGVKKSERRRMLSFEETLRRVPMLKKNGLIGGGRYVEYRTDDSRLTLEVIKAAVKKGTIALNYTKVDRLIYKQGKVIGVEVVDQLTGHKYEVKAIKIINATGPWVDTIREKDGSKKGKTLILSKGVHIVFDQSKFPLQQAVYFDTQDGRMVFAIPRNGKTYVGTTDTFYHEDAQHPGMTVSDRSYLLNAVNYMFPELKATEKDVESSWAGIRPLIHEEGKDPSAISRKDEIWESESGLITIAGGKLTGYRKMAETIVDLISNKLASEENRSFPACETKYMPISGGHVGGALNLDRYVSSVLGMGVEAGLKEEDARHLGYLFGSNAPVVFEILKENKAVADEYGIPLPVFAKLAYGIKHEMIATPTDFYFRRTGDLLFNIKQVKAYKDRVIQFVADQFSWSEEELNRHKTELEKEIFNAEIPIED